jgi:hypothetical protein
MSLYLFNSRIIIENVEALITKAILNNSVEMTSIIVLLMQLVNKLFDPNSLKNYYKVFLKCLKKTSKDFRIIFD